MERPGHFATRVMARRAVGRAAYDEIRRPCGSPVPGARFLPPFPPSSYCLSRSAGRE